MAAVTQANRLIAVESPLGEDVLLFRSMKAAEALSQPFEFILDLLSEDMDVKLEDLIGRTMTLRLALPETEEPRYFNGYISRFGYAGNHGRYAAYQATLRPWLWLLTRTANCRIFQEKNIPDIIKDVFRARGLTDFEEHLSGSYRQWEYCVQYRETDFSFVSRLMEMEGIYYFFKHTSGKHTLVLADSYSAHDPVPGYAEIPYFPPTPQGRRKRDHIWDWTVEQQVQPSACALNDFDFKAPRKGLRCTSAMSQQHPQADFEIYDYPGAYIDYGDGNNYARIRIEELHAQHEQARGRGDARGLSVGALFKLTDFPRADQNREYLLVSATHRLQNNAYESHRLGEPEESYECEFSAMDARQPYRSPRQTSKPVVHGPQTAIVVGKVGEEIWTDKYGRVKVQFHWDRYGDHDENSSCWVRVSQNRSGKKWGEMYIPHIGQEVIVSFLEGDPDQPVITGRVYNADNMPPLELPANKSKSVMRDHGGNEIVMEGATGGQQMKLHSPTHNTTVTLGNSFNVATESDVNVDNEGNTLWQTAGQWRQNIVGKYEIKGGGDILSVFAGIKNDTVFGSRSEITLGNKNETAVGVLSEICGGWKFDVHRGGNKHDSSCQINTFSAYQQTNSPWVRTNTSHLEVNCKGAKLDMTPGKIELKCGGSSITITPSEITLSAPKIQLTTGGTATVSASDVVLKTELVNATGDVRIEKDLNVRGSSFQHGSVFSSKK